MPIPKPLSCASDYIHAERQRLTKLSKSELADEKLMVELILAIKEHTCSLNELLNMTER